MSILADIAREHDTLTAIRRDIHAHPEIAFEEQRTSDLVASKLQQWGIEVHRGLGKTGLVGVLRGTGNGASGGTDGTQPARTIGLRADMDALPMPEHNRFAHASIIPGRMHGCGHDGHTAILLGAAQYLAQHRDFDGTVHFIFQPAEEGGHAGARAMMADGLFERFPCDAVFGLHNAPGMDTGTFGFRAGKMMASSNLFEIRIIGTGGHAAAPHLTVDPIVIAAELVGALQSIVSRNKSPIENAVLSVTQIHAGDAYNVIPGEAIIRGTVRTYTTDMLDMIEARLRALATTLPQAYGATGELDFERCYPPLVNWAAPTEFAAKVAEDMFGADKVIRDIPPTTGSEDFAFFLEKIPGCYLRLGNGNGEHRLASYHGMGPCLLHNTNYDFNDALLPIGASYWVHLVRAFFAQPRPEAPSV